LSTEPTTPKRDTLALHDALPILLEGDAAKEIVELARDSQCDLIVMGTHGRTGLGRLLMGSVAEQVMRRAPCPVLTIKAPIEAARSEEHTSELQSRVDLVCRLLLE